MISNGHRKSVNRTAGDALDVVRRCRPSALERHAADRLAPGRPVVAGEEEHLGEQQRTERDRGRALVLDRSSSASSRSTPSSMITNRNSTTIALA